MAMIVKILMSATAENARAKIARLRKMLSHECQLC